MNRQTLCARLLRTIGASFALATTAVSAAPITVSSLADNVFVNAAGATFSDTALTQPVVSTSCTLRMALAAANIDTAVGGCAAGNGVDTIEFGALTGTIEVANQSMSVAPSVEPPTPTHLLIASRGVTINGPASGTLVISGANLPSNSTKRLLVMSDGDGTTDLPMSVSRVTFEKGRIVANVAGCLFSRESLTLTDVKFDRCESVGVSSSTIGGFAGALGVWVDASVVGPTYVRPNVTLLRVTATGNRAIRGTKTSRADAGFASFGTGTANQAGVISITDSSFSLNSAQRYGAFLADNVTSVTITNTRVFSNTATDSGITTENAGRFGGFAVFNVTGDVNISGGSVVGNFAERERAGLQVSNVTGNVTISGLDVIGNTANQERGGMSIFTVAGNVSLSDLTIAGNIAPNGRVGGLEISTDTFATNGNCNFAQLRPASLTNVVVRGNFAATNTGGLRIFCSGAVAMSGMSIESNEVSGSTVASVGGGLGAGQLFNNTSVTLTNSTISGNKTYSNPIDQSGGFGNLGLYGNGSVVISGVTVKGNWVEQNEAGITVFAQSGTSPAGTVSIENSAFYDNRAKGLMGLWINGAGTYSIKNTTFAGNSSTATGGTVVGLNAHTGSSAPINVSLENVTIARNGPNDNPFTDGAFAPSPTVPVPNLNLTIKNSILGQYQAVNGPGAFLNGTSGYNYTIQNSLFENTNLPSGVCGTNGVICGVDAKLESLNHNGGNTMTLALRPGSAALDSGAVTTLTTDQRGAGFPRVVGAAVDMGAFESPALTAATPCKLDMDGDNQVTATKEGLVLLRAMLGFSEANAVPGTGISQSQWNTTRVNLNANCGTIFAP